MHIGRMDLNLFVVLQAVYVEGSITRASRRLNVTQPAVSHALRRLRGILGDPLFIRHGTTIAPTPFTRNLMGPVHAGLSHLQAAINSAPAFDPATMPRRFNIGIRDLLEITVLPPLVNRLFALSPQSQINCLALDPDRLGDELATGKLDCAIELPLNLDEPIARTLAGTDRMIVLARPGHPAARDGALAFDAYMACSHIAVSSRRTGHTLEDTVLNRGGRQRRVVVRVQRPGAAIEILAGTDLLLTMPFKYAQNIQVLDRHDWFELPFTVPAIEYYIYWHKSMENDPAGRWIRQQILDALADDGFAYGGSQLQAHAAMK